MQEAKIRYYKDKLNKYGAFKSMFSFDALPQYIVKTWKPFSDSAVKKEYETSLKYPDLYAKITKVNWDKRWLAQEKLDTMKRYAELKKELKKETRKTVIKKIESELKKLQKQI